MHQFLFSLQLMIFTNKRNHAWFGYFKRYNISKFEILKIPCLNPFTVISKYCGLQTSNALEVLTDIVSIRIRYETESIKQTFLTEINLGSCLKKYRENPTL